MSKNKQDLVYSNFYAPHLGGFKSNPVDSQQGLTQRMYRRVLTELCVNRFEWVGLPDSIDKRFLEINLFYRALTVFYWDKDFDKYLALQASGVGSTNHYDNPTQFTVYGNSVGRVINKTLGGNDCVPIWANYLRMPDTDIVNLYSMKLADLDRTIEIASQNLRNPVLIAVPEHERHSYMQIMKKVRAGESAIFGSQAMASAMGESIQSIDMGGDSQALMNLWIAKTKMWNECMGLLGINNANQDKKERLVADEVAANDEQVESAKNVNLQARQDACALIKRLTEQWSTKPGAKSTGLNVSVRYKSDVNRQDIALGMGY